jgi:hypothetical protein
VRHIVHIGQCGSDEAAALRGRVFGIICIHHVDIIAQRWYNVKMRSEGRGRDFSYCAPFSAPERGRNPVLIQRRSDKGALGPRCRCSFPPALNKEAI